MNIINDKRGLSGLEVFCITGICILVALVTYWAVAHYLDSMARGDDALRINTAESVARNNLMSGGCVVDNCVQKKGKCSHKTGDGSTLGYYDSVTHHIVADKMAGYNEHVQTSSEDASIEGEPGTMILAVYGKDMKVTVRWIEGEKQ